MSLLAYDDPIDTDDFGMKRASVISNGSANGDLSTAEVQELRAALAAAREATATAETKVHVLEDELARLKDQHAFVSATKEAVQQQLREETVKREAAEDKVELLRGQVEQARRSVMALQKQEQDRAVASRAASGTGPASAVEEPSNTKKRHSLYGRGRPMSTASIASEGGDSIATPPPSSGLRELRLGSHNRQQSLALRVSTDGSSGVPKSPRSASSAMSSALSPGTAKPRVAPEVFDDADKDPSPTNSASLSTSSASRPSRAASFDTTAAAAPNAELLATQAEVAALRQQLEALTIQFAESEEARIASESCVKALREFIASDPNPGTGLSETISLPPLPTDKAADDIDEPGQLPATSATQGQGQAQGQAKWGFGGLWSKPAAPAPAAAANRSSIDASPQISVTPPEVSPRGSIIGSPPPNLARVDEDPGMTPAGLGRSFTSFFGRRRQSKSTTIPAPAAASAASGTAASGEPTQIYAEPMSAEALGLHLEDLAISLPPPPSAPDVELTMPTPRAAAHTTAPKAEPEPEVEPKDKENKELDDVSTTAPLNIRRTPSPSPRAATRSPAPTVSPIAETESPVSPEKATSVRSGSPPPASVTTNEDDIATPADSPVVEDAAFQATSIEAEVKAEGAAEGEEADEMGQKPVRPPRGEARRGRARGRGRRGAA